jgi:AAA domain
MATAVQNLLGYKWFEEPEVTTPWLVYGLIPADGYSSICGKPKAGKSTAVRNLIVSVIKSTPFLGRVIDLPGRVGRVLYLHLDRKDNPGRVSAQLKQLGLTEEDAPRLTIRLAEHLPSKDYGERLKWLQDEVKASAPDLIVIDLMWQFVVAKNSNDYNAVLDGINDLQDALNEVGYKGALVAVMHGRKATNPNDQFDDFLGSTGQRGSFSTNIMLSQYKKDKLRTIASDQTDIEDRLGEIPETAIIRDPDGSLRLGPPVTELLKIDKKSKDEEDITKLLVFLDNNPGVEMETIIDGLAMSKKRTLSLLREVKDLTERAGKGVKGDPYLYFPKGGENAASIN